MISNKVALVTAGGSGMGAHVAQRLAQDGYTVGILSSSGRGEALANQLGGFGVTGSNQSNEDLKRLVDKALDKYGRIDAVVNSAGHGQRGVIAEISDEQWFDAFNIYFMNVVRTSRLVIPTMLNQKHGSIVNISAYGALQPSPLFPTSSVIRAALSNYVKLSAQTYAKDNIRMNNVLPGFINSMDLDREWLDRIPMGRFGEMQEVSSLISLLVSDVGAYITGQDILIDGGLVK